MLAAILRENALTMSEKNMHHHVTVAGCLLTLFLVASCGQEEVVPTPPEPEVSVLPTDTEPEYPMDRHRGRSLKEWIDEIDGDDRFKAFKAIVAVGEMEQDGVLAIPSISRRLHDKESDGGLKRKAIAALGRIGGPEAIAALDSSMAGTDEILGVLAADALGAMGSSAVDSILPYLKSANGSVRHRAARALKGVLSTDGTVTKMEQAVVPLAHALGDSEQNVRATALDVLSELGPRAVSATPVIIEQLELATDREHRKLLMVMVSTFGPSAGDAVQVLRKNLKDEDAQIRLFAGLGLAKIGLVDEGVDVLLEFLEGEDEQLQIAAADALRRVGPAASAAVEPLKQARKSASETMHLMIEQALKAIRGRS